MRSRPRWFDNVYRRENNHVLKSTDQVLSHEKDLHEDQKLWIDCVKRDPRTLSLKLTDCLDRMAWKNVVSFSIKQLKCHSECPHLIARICQAFQVYNSLRNFRMSNPATMGKRTINALVGVIEFPEVLPIFFDFSNICFSPSREQVSCNR